MIRKYEETISFPPDAEKRENIRKLIEKGYINRCLRCGKVYKTLPEKPYEDGHGGRVINACSCGGDMFERLENVICRRVEIAYDKDGFMAFKQHHFKYCVCDKGEAWTGDAETECGCPLILEGDVAINARRYRCQTGERDIIILRSTDRELSEPDELGSEFLRYP